MASESQVFALSAHFETCPGLRIPEEESEATRFIIPTIQWMQRLTETEIKKKI